MDVLERATRDLDQGRPWMARDRLASVLHVRPTDPDVFDLLGCAHMALNDLPAAGAAWFLTARPDDDPELAVALSALRGRYRHAGAVAMNLHVRRRFDDYAPNARARLVALREEVQGQNWDWDPPQRPRPPAGDGGNQTSTAALAGRGPHIAGVAVAVFLLINVGLWLLGVIALVGWVL